MRRLGFLFAILSLVLIASARPSDAHGAMLMSSSMSRTMANMVPGALGKCAVAPASKEASPATANKGCCDNGAPGSSCDVCCVAIPAIVASLPTPTPLMVEPAIAKRAGYYGRALPPIPPPPRSGRSASSN